MAGPSAPIRAKSVRRFVLACLFAAALCTNAGGAAAASSRPNSNAGLFSSSPDWGAGAQIGNYGGTALSLQKMAFLGGGLNLALGLEDGSIGLATDYVRFFGNGLHPLTLGSRDGYKKVRGQLTPFVGAGLQIAKGVGIRIPAGLQYAMLRSPFAFYGGAALYVGPFLAGGSIGPQLWFNLGGRIFL